MTPELSDNILQFINTLPDVDASPVEDKTPKPVGKECQHFKVYLDAQNRTVICRDCKKQVDPFWYLSLLASEWARRTHENERILVAKTALDQARRDAQVKGHWFHRPKDGPKADAWDMATLALGKEPLSMYRQGSQYMAEESPMFWVSLEYAQMCARQRGGKGSHETRTQAV